MSDENTIHCRYHCASCGLHFASLAGFDLHRTGSFRRPGARRCLSPTELRDMRGVESKRRVLRLVRTGVCRLTNGEERIEGAKVWQTR